MKLSCPGGTHFITVTKAIIYIDLFKILKRGNNLEVISKMILTERNLTINDEKLLFVLHNSAATIFVPCKEKHKHGECILHIVNSKQLSHQIHPQ